MEKRKEIMEQLQDMRDQMMDPSTGQYVNESSPYSLHMAEQGTDAQEREKLYLWAQRENKFLGYLEEALQRIDDLQETRIRESQEMTKDHYELASSMEKTLDAVLRAIRPKHNGDK